MPPPDLRGIYFNSTLLPEPQNNYVCWLDVMGTAQLMLRSLPIGANFVFKLHCAVLEAQQELALADSVMLYPVMDGVFITSHRRRPLQNLLNQALCRLAITFLAEPKPFHRFLVRAAVAFGPIFHGSNVPRTAAAIISPNQYVFDSILMGIPMAQAYQTESHAPPFGIAIHESARTFAPENDRPFRFLWLDWFDHCTPAINREHLLAALTDYFNWHKEHTNLTGYRTDRIEHHFQLAREYFTPHPTPRREDPEGQAEDQTAVPADTAPQA